MTSVSVTGWEAADLVEGGNVHCLLNDPTTLIPALSRILEDYVRVDLCRRCGCG